MGQDAKKFRHSRMGIEVEDQVGVGGCSVIRKGTDLRIGHRVEATPLIRTRPYCKLQFGGVRLEPLGQQS